MPGHAFNESHAQRSGLTGGVSDRLHWIGGAGDDCVPGHYSIGIRTFTSSIANVAPRLSLRLHELASAAHSAELTRLMDELVIPLYALRARHKGYEVSAMKAMMDLDRSRRRSGPSAAGRFTSRRTRIAARNDGAGLRGCKESQSIRSESSGRNIRSSIVR